MAEINLKRQKKIQGIVLLTLIFAFIIYFLFFTPVSPVGADFRGAPSGEKTAAAGFWGTIGFFKDPVDNNNTYFLMLMFFTLAISKTVRSSFFTAGKGKKGNGPAGRALRSAGGGKNRRQSIGG